MRPRSLAAATVGAVARIAAVATIAALMIALTDVAIATTPQDIQQRVGITPQLGHSLSPGTSVQDESGSTLPLTQLLNGKPAILALVYYGCANLCSMTLAGIGGSLHRMELRPGRDFEILAMSIDPREGPSLAASKRAEYVRRYSPARASCTSCDPGWHFLTGTALQSKSVAAAVGYRYFWDASLNQYAHPAGIVVLSPRGRITQYFNGIEFPSAELQQALRRAAAEQVSSLSDRLWLLCYHYEALVGPYSAQIAMALRVLGLIGVLALGGFIVRLIRTSP